MTAWPWLQLSFVGPAPLYDEPVDEVTRRLGAFIQPNPTFGGDGLLNKILGVNLTAAAIRKLHTTCTDGRATGYVTGSPGRGKTLFLLLLLVSRLPSYRYLISPLSSDMRRWWLSLPVFVVSFNGLTKMAVEDHVLAWIYPRLPVILRIIFGESYDVTSSTSNFETYRYFVLEQLTAGKITAAELNNIAFALVQARLQASNTSFLRGVMLIDELPRLSMTALSDADISIFEERIKALQVDKKMHKQREAIKKQDDEERAAPVGPAALVRPAAAVKALGAAAAKTVEVATESVDVASIGELHFSTSVQDRGSFPEDPLMQTAEAVRKSSCDWCEMMRIRPVMTSFNERFAERQAGLKTGSLSTVVELVQIPLLPADELRKELAAHLVHIGVNLRRTTPEGQRRRLSAVTFAEHIARITLGHPRAVSQVDVDLSASTDGDVVFGLLLTSLNPTRLSVAQKSVGILAENPLVLAAGLLNYDVPTSGRLTASLSWDTVFGEGALWRRPRARSKSGNPSIIVSFFLAALEELNVPDAVGSEHHVVADNDNVESSQDAVAATTHVISRDDCGIYAACWEIRRALLVGNVPVAWENLFLWTEVLLSRARTLMLRHEAVLKGGRRVPYGKYTMRKLYPVPGRLTGSARWLSRALLDAGAPRRGVMHFDDIPKLLENTDEVLLDHVWRPLKSNFTGLDGVMFFRCVQGTLGGPRKGELVMVLVEFKSGTRLSVKGDIADSCSSLSETFGLELWDSWKRRMAQVFVVRATVPGSLDLRTRAPALSIDSAIVVDMDSMEKVYGTTMSTFAVCAESLFGTSVLRTKARLGPPSKRRLGRRKHSGSSGDLGAGEMSATNS